LNEETYAFASSVLNIKDPESIQEARSLDDWPLWEEAINKELRQLNDMHAWDLVEPPNDANVVGSKFVFHYKTDAEGNISSRKARLVALGYTQIKGIDYNETFAPTAKLTAI
jgi:hypothetical protein